jgi:hypothetical protein
MSPHNLDADLSILITYLLDIYPELNELVRMVIPKTRFLGTRVSGQRAGMLLPEMVVFG